MRKKLVAVLIAALLLTLVMTAGITYAYFTFMKRTGNDYTLSADNFRFRFNDVLIDDTVNETITIDKGGSASFRVNLSVLTSVNINESYINYEFSVKNSNEITPTQAAQEKGITVYLQVGTQVVSLGNLYDLIYGNASAGLIRTGSLGCSDETEFIVILENSSSNNELLHTVQLGLTFTATPIVVNENFGDRYYCRTALDFAEGLVSGKTVTLFSDLTLPAGTVTDADFRAIDLNGHTITCTEPYTVIMKSDYINPDGIIWVADKQHRTNATDMSGFSLSFAENTVPVVGQYAFSVDLHAGEECSALLNAISSAAGGELYGEGHTVNFDDYLAPYPFELTLFNYSTLDFETLDGGKFTFSDASSTISHTVTYALTLRDNTLGTYSANFDVSYRGTENFDVADYYLSQIPDTVTSSLFMPSHDDYSGSDIKWETDNASFIDSYGVFRVDFANNANWKANTVKIGVYVSSNGVQYYASKTVNVTATPELRLQYLLHCLRADIDKSGPIDPEAMFINGDYRVGAVTDNGTTGALGLLSYSVTGLSTDWAEYISYTLTDGVYDNLAVNALPSRYVGKIMALNLDFVFADGATATKNLLINIAGTSNNTGIIDLETQIEKNFEQFNSAISTNSGQHNYLKSYTDEGYFIYYSIPAEYSGYITLVNGDVEPVTAAVAAEGDRILSDSSLFVKYINGGVAYYAHVLSSELCNEKVVEGSTVYVACETAADFIDADYIRIDDQLYPIVKGGGDGKILIFQRTPAEIIMMQASAAYPTSNSTAFVGAEVYDRRVEGSQPIDNIWTAEGESGSVLQVPIQITGIIKENIDIRDSLIFQKLVELYDTNRDGFITCDEIRNPAVKSIDLSGLASTDITGLRYFVGLEEIDLSNNQLENISELSGMTQLKKLNLSANKLTSLSAISGLFNLTELNISGNSHISDLSSLQYLIWLTSLDISGDVLITDMSALQNLSRLTTLKMNGITTISGDSEYYIFLARYRAGFSFVFLADSIVPAINVNDTDTLTAVEIMDYVIEITEYRHLLYLPRNYTKGSQNYDVVWATDSDLIHITYDADNRMTGYTLQQAVIDTPVTLTMTLIASDGTRISFSRTFRLTCLQYNTGRNIYLRGADGDVLFSTVVPDSVLRAAIYNAAKNMENAIIKDADGNIYLDTAVLAGITSFGGSGAPLTGVSDITGIGEALPGLASLDLRGSGVTNLSPVPVTVEKLWLSGYDYDYTELLRFDVNDHAVNYLRELYVNGCYNLTEEQTLNRLYQVYMANDDGVETNSQHVNIFLTEDLTNVWNPFTEYNLRYSDSILSYISMQKLGNYSLYRNNSDVYSMYAKYKDGNFYYEFEYFGDTENKLSYYVDGTSAVELVYGSSYDDGNTIKTNVQAVSGANGHCEAINYKSLVSSAKVSYIRVTYKSTRVIHGEYIQFKKAIQLKFEYDEQIRIFNTEDGKMYQLEEIFPGEDIRNYVLTKMSSWAVKSNGGNIEGTYYVGNGSFLSDAQTAGYRQLVGTVITGELTKPNDLTVYGQYIANQNGTAYALSGLRFLTNVKAVYIFRDAYIASGIDLCNIRELKVSYSNLDLSGIQVENTVLQKLQAESRVFGINFYNGAANVYIRSSDNAVFIGFTAPDGYNADGYKTYTLSEFFQQRNQNASYAYAELFPAMVAVIDALNNDSVTYTGGIHAKDVFYLYNFPSVQELSLVECAISDYMFLLPYINRNTWGAQLQTLKLYNTGGIADCDNVNLDSTFGLAIMDDIYRDGGVTLYLGGFTGGVLTSPKDNTTPVSETNIWKDIQYPVVTTEINVQEEQLGYTYVKESGNVYPDEQYFYAGDRAVLPSRFTFGGETYRILWELHGSGNVRYFNDLLKQTAGYEDSPVQSVGTVRIGQLPYTDADWGLGKTAIAYGSSANSVFLPSYQSGETVNFVMPAFAYDTYFFLTASVRDSENNALGANFVFPILLIHSETLENNPTGDGISSGAYLNASDYGFSGSDSSTVRLFRWACRNNNANDAYEYNYAQSNILDAKWRGGVYGSYRSFADPDLRFIMYLFLGWNGSNQGSATCSFIKDASMALPGAFFLTYDTALINSLSSSNRSFTLQIPLIKNLSVVLPKDGTGDLSVTVGGWNRPPSETTIYMWWEGCSSRTDIGSGAQIGSKDRAATYSWNTGIYKNWRPAVRSLDGMEIFNGLQSLNVVSDALEDVTFLSDYKPIYKLPLHTGTKGYDASNALLPGLQAFTGTTNNRYALGRLETLTLGVDHTASRTFTLFGMNGGTQNAEFTVVPDVSSSYSYTYNSACYSVSNATTSVTLDFAELPKGSIISVPDSFISVSHAPLYIDFYLEFPSDSPYVTGATNVLNSPNAGYKLVNASQIFISGNLKYILGLNVTFDGTNYRSKVIGYEDAVDTPNGISEGGMIFRLTSNGYFYISYEDVTENVRAFQTGSYGVTSLEGMQVFTKLESIKLIKNNLTDISCLRTLHLKSFSYANSATTNNNKFVISFWQPLIQGSADTLEVFNYTYDVTGYQPDPSMNHKVYLDELTYLLEFKKLSSVNIGFSNGEPAIYLDMPSAKYVLNKLLDKEIYPELTNVILFGQPLRENGVDSLSLVMEDGTDYIITNSGYLFAKNILSEIVPHVGSDKNANGILLSETGYSFILSPSFMYQGVIYRIEWKSLSPNVKITIVDSAGNPVSIDTEEALFGETMYYYKVDVTQTSQPITTYLIASVMIDGSLYVRPYYIDIYQSSVTD